MNTCRLCRSPIPVNARKCPGCGAATIEETVDCLRCGKEVDLNASFCAHCGAKLFEEKKEKEHFIFETSHLDKLDRDITSRFNKAFQNRLNEEHLASRHDLYNGRLAKSDFRNSIDFRIKQLVEKAAKAGQSAAGKKALKNIQHKAFEELIDYFIITHCSDLNETNYSEKILKYQGLPLSKLNLSQLISDYLDYEKGDLTFYNDFVQMPAQKLKNAADSFLFPKKGETLFLICDLSLLGNCKEGFALTNKGIYWKNLLEKPQRVYYHKLKEVKREEDWITINGIFFNAKKSLNLKIIRLLKKLSDLFEE